MADYSEDQKLIGYRFDELHRELRDLRDSHVRQNELLTMIHSDFIAYKKAWRIIFTMASTAGTVLSTIVGWFMHVWTSGKP